MFLHLLHVLTAQEGATDTTGDMVGQAGDFVTQMKDWLVSPEGGIKWGINIVVFLLILLGAKIVGNIVGNLLRKGMSTPKLKASDLLKDFFVNSVRKIIFLVALIMGLGQLGVDIGPLLAGIGVVGFVVGFALQDSLNNFASGVMILLYRPYDVGDYVELAGQSGTVEAMSLVSTTLKTPDNQRLTVPNGKIWGDVIRNVTANPTRRVDMVFGIGYGDDMEKAAKIIEGVLAKHELVLDDPAPVIKVSELGDSSVNFVVRPWCKTSDYWNVKFDLTRQVKERFDAEGVSIPFPQRDVHLFQAS